MPSAQASPARVAFVSSHAPLGGAELYLSRIVAAMPATRRAGVVVLQDGPLVELLHNQGADVSVIRTAATPMSLARAAITLRTWLGAQRCDLVHANGLKAALVVAMATPGQRKRLIWMKHDLAGGRLLNALLVLRCRAVVAVSETVKGSFAPRVRSRVSVVRNGVEIPDVDGRSTEATVRNLVGPHPTVIVVGRLCPGKGQMEIVEVLPEVVRRVPDVRVLVVGGADPAFPDYERRLRARARALGVSQLLTFTGHRPDAGELISGSDVLVAPSTRDPVHGWSEGFGLAVAEAMALGTPVVAYDNGSLTETLSGSGWVVTEGDRAALGVAVAEMLTDRLLRQRAAAAGLEIARSKFAPRAALHRLFTIYDEVAP